MTDKRIYEQIDKRKTVQSIISGLNRYIESCHNGIPLVEQPIGKLPKTKIIYEVLINYCSHYSHKGDSNRIREHVMLPAFFTKIPAIKFNAIIKDFDFDRSFVKDREYYDEKIGWYFLNIFKSNQLFTTQKIQFAEAHRLILTLLEVGDPFLKDYVSFVNYTHGLKRFY